jgi:hypothetical protein
MRKVATATGLLVLCQALNASAASSLRPQMPLHIAQNEERILDDPSLPPATDLTVRADCDRLNLGLPLAVFSWASTAGDRGEKRVEITPFRNGFSLRRAEVIGEVPPEQATLQWRGGEAGINYYWRVLTRTSDGWVASRIARYEVPTCPVDYERSTDTPR